MEERGPTLASTEFIDAEHEDVVRMRHRVTAGAGDERLRAARLFAAVRDEVRYSVRVDFGDRSGYRASATLARGAGFCVQKAVLLAALLRGDGIPARLHFADLRNRLVPPRLRDLMGTDLFRYHCYVELLLDGRWLKVTPSFDPDTRRRQGMRRVDFDGTGDAMLHPTDVHGRPQFEYVADHGVRDDLPFDELLDVLVRSYPRYDPDAWSKAFGQEGGPG